MTCPVCHRPAVHDLVNPGPEWGPTHRACFARVDALSEALEHEFGAVCDPELVAGMSELAALRLVRSITDLVGHRFGRLLVMERAVILERSGRTRQSWRVRCDCGREVIMRAESLRNGARQCQPCALACRRGGWSKLTAAEVARLRALRAQKAWPLRRLAEQFGISTTEAHYIVRGRCWRAVAA